MSYQINDKVACVDATPIPTYTGTILDYSFPGGFIEEGAIYCVAGFVDNPGGHTGMLLSGVPACWRSAADTGWNPSRFRLVNEASNYHEATAELAL